MSDRALMTWWSRPPFASVEELRSYFAQAPGSWRAWAITWLGDDQAIGFVAAGEKRPGVVEVGYLVVSEAQGRGVALEALTGLIKHLFVEGERRVFADVDPENEASVALLERIGFQLEGRLRGEWHTHIGVRDSLIYGLLAADWQPAAPG